MTYTLSIEPVHGETFQHGFHLGTDLRVAKICAADTFNFRNKFAREHSKDKFLTRTVAIKLNGKIVDVYDGDWQSEYLPIHAARTFCAD